MSDSAPILNCSACWDVEPRLGIYVLGALSCFELFIASDTLVTIADEVDPDCDCLRILVDSEDLIFSCSPVDT